MCGNPNPNPIQDAFELGDQIRVTNAAGTDTGFFIAFQGALIIWGREAGGTAVLAVTDRTGATIEKI